MTKNRLQRVLFIGAFNVVVSYYVLCAGAPWGRRHALLMEGEGRLILKRFIDVEARFGVRAFSYFED